MVAIFLIFQIINLYQHFGFCIFGTCDTKIKITSVDYPKLVQFDQSFPVSFTVSNTGDNAVKSCILHFVENPECYACNVLSSPFSLEPDDELEIKLESSGLSSQNMLFGRIFEFAKERTMTAWVVCENTESFRTNFKSVGDVKSITEKIEDYFTPENP